MDENSKLISQIKIDMERYLRGMSNHRLRFYNYVVGGVAKIPGSMNQELTFNLIALQREVQRSIDDLEKYCNKEVTNYFDSLNKEKPFNY
jgi:hypothetical protein